MEGFIGTSSTKTSDDLTYFGYCEPQYLDKSKNLEIEMIFYMHVADTNRLYVYR